MNCSVVDLWVTEVLFGQETAVFFLFSLLKFGGKKAALLLEESMQENSQLLNLFSLALLFTIICYLL